MELTQNEEDEIKKKHFTRGTPSILYILDPVENIVSSYN